MNLAVAPALPASPVADGSVTAAGHSEGPATGFDALLALVDAALDGAPVAALPLAEPAVAEAPVAEDGDPAATPAADPMLAALAALMIPPAPLADPTVPVTPPPPAQADLASAAPALPLPQIFPEPAAQPGPAADKPATFDVAAPPPAAPAAPTAPIAAPVITTAAATAPPATTPVASTAPAPVAPKAPGKSETPARHAAAPAGEPTAKPTADAVATQTAEAVTAVAGGSGKDASAQGAPQTEIAAAAPTATNSASTPAPVRTADTLAPVAEAMTVVRGSPDTVARLSADILKKLDGRSTRFEVALDPLGLGRVDVKMEIGSNGQVTAALSFDTAHAAAELRGRASELRHALQQAGFDLPEGALSFDVGGQAGGDGRGAQTAWDFEGRGQGRGGAFAGHAFEAVLNGAEGLFSDLPTRLGAPRADGVDVRI